MNRQEREDNRSLQEGENLNSSDRFQENKNLQNPSIAVSLDSEIYREALQILRCKFKRQNNNSGEKCQSTSIKPRTSAENNLSGDTENKNCRVDEYIPARMINEFVYCPRLFYYEFVEGVFRDSADTLKGSAVHARVDKGSGEMPPPQKEISDDSQRNKDESVGEVKGDRETIHSRSVILSSDSLMVIAKIDLVEITTICEENTEKYIVCPVDYKSGEPKKQSDGPGIWDSDKIQLALQCILLRENGYECNEGIIYYSSTRQKVHLSITEDLVKWVVEQVKKAREVAGGEIPPPLAGSPKCVRCSLAPICLPDETNFLKNDAYREQQERRINQILDDEETSLKNGTIYPREKVRRLISPRDDTRALYLTTQGLKVGRRDETLEIKDDQKLLETVRLKDISHVAIFGNIQLTTQAIQALCNSDIPITYFSTGGWFYGITRGHSIKNVFLRISQFQVASDESNSIKIAGRMIFAKIRNQRTMLMRNHIDPPKNVIKKLKILSDETLKVSNYEELLGIEGVAANLYFENFSGLIKINDKIGSVMEEPDAEETRVKADYSDFMTFDFRNRNRRPPRDPVNALFSLGYSLLAKDCTVAVLSVGFDPYIGFYHKPRFGRPALALDLMEEFRPLIADSAVITAINNRIITLKDFIRAGKSVNLTPDGRKKFFYVYEQRINTLVTHPLFDYKVTYRRALELQARILARTLTGEIANYVPFITR